ncbi:unnamed protein product [Rangifer tarandus platyrhynchus]|uniref:Uncharacterized protein n=1 Tax=Rangifer tarandus platyrhynchus TaxID=3082113 RepID=A0AC59ZW21_RANTA
MKALLLPIALSLLTALRAQEPPSCPLEPQQIAGTWYVKAVVTDKNMPKEMRPRKSSPVTLTALGGGDLEIRFTLMKEDQCHEKITRMQPTGEPGKYSASGGKKHIYILELPVEGHYILFCQGQLQGKSVQVGKLIGRNPDVSPEALEAFKKFAQRKGLSPEDVFTPEQMGEGPAHGTPGSSLHPLHILDPRNHGGLTQPDVNATATVRRSPRASGTPSGGSRSLVLVWLPRAHRGLCSGLCGRAEARISIDFLPGKGYAVVHSQGRMDRTYFRMAMLIGCSLEESPEALRTFEEFVESKGLNKTEMVSPCTWAPSPLPQTSTPCRAQKRHPGCSVKRPCSPCAWPGVWHPDPRHHPDHEGPEAEGGRGGGELQGSWAAEA